MIYNFPQDHEDLPGMLALVKNLKTTARGERTYYIYGEYYIEQSQDRTGCCFFFIHYIYHDELKIGNYHGPSKYGFGWLHTYGIPKDMYYISREEWDKHPKVREARLGTLIAEVMDEV